eukprot:scaffold302221_cov21-Tisochrysis_lutea.AAC.1
MEMRASGHGSANKAFTLLCTDRPPVRGSVASVMEVRASNRAFTSLRTDRPPVRGWGARIVFVAQQCR